MSGKDTHGDLTAVDRPTTTVDRTLGLGPCQRSGSHGVYHGLAPMPGERHRPRTDFVTGDAGDPAGRGRGRRGLVTLAHLTDLHVVDAQSPARLDFAMRVGAGTPSWAGAVDYTFRPQELMVAHAAASMAATLARLGVDLTVVTGDNTDNTQANELDAYLAALDGGTVHPVSAGGTYHGPQSPDWDDDWYWRPDPGPDRYKRRWGFPTHAGLVEAASRPFAAPGLGMPWITCIGNHDLLLGGTTAVTDELRRIAVGSGKAVALPAGADLADALGVYMRQPELLFSGPALEVTADPRRHLLSAREYVAAHRAGPALVPGHGFTAENERTGRGNYVHEPVPGVLVVVLDTNHREGYWDGSIDRDQLDWLRGVLDGARGPDGPLVVLASHHATPSLGNAYGVCPDRAHAVAYARELLAAALDSPNVVLWLNGHHHANRVVAHHRPGGGGLFEVTTASVTDWPCQARLVELAVESDGTLCMTSTMVDHDAPVAVTGPPDGPRWLAGLHRELAANECWRGGRQGLGGGPDDRNVHMRLPMP